MDKTCLKIPCRTDSHEQEHSREKDSYVEAPGVEVPLKASIRRSSRLHSKKKVSSCTQHACRSYHTSSNYGKKSLKACVDRENSISESKIENKHKLQHINNEDSYLFSADTASMKSYAAVPSFKYNVRAKDGIRLVVDLNLKQSVWLKSMEKAVCVCQNHQKPGFESFRKEVECLGLGDRNNLKISSPDKTTVSDGSMNSYAQNQFSIRSMSKEIEKTLPSVVEKEVPTISGLEFSTRDGYSPNAECLENVAFCSEENQFSGFSSHQKGSSCSRTGKMYSEDLLNSTLEVNQETAGNHRRSTVENGVQESINSAEEMEVSGRDGSMIVISASDDGPKRRKHNNKSNYIHGQSHERVLRSTKLFGGQILEQDGIIIRRSSRLFSKAVPFAGRSH